MYIAKSPNRPNRITCSNLTAKWLIRESANSTNVGINTVTALKKSGAVTYSSSLATARVMLNTVNKVPAMSTSQPRRFCIFQ